MIHRPHFDVGKILAAHDRAVAASVAAAQADSSSELAAQIRLGPPVMRIFWERLVQEINGDASDTDIMLAVASLMANMAVAIADLRGGDPNEDLNYLLQRCRRAIIEARTDESIHGAGERVTAETSGRA